MGKKYLAPIHNGSKNNFPPSTYFALEWDASAKETKYTREGGKKTTIGSEREKSSLGFIKAAKYISCARILTA